MQRYRRLNWRGPPQDRQSPDVSGFARSEFHHHIIKEGSLWNF